MSEPMDIVTHDLAYAQGLEAGRRESLEKLTPVQLFKLLDDCSLQYPREFDEAMFDLTARFGRAQREMGRRDILALVAKVSPWWHNPEDEPGIISRCVGCDVPEGDEHAPDCLWRRAQQATLTA